MQLVSFRTGDGPLCAGFLEADLIVAAADLGYPDTMRQLLIQHGHDLEEPVAAARTALASGHHTIAATNVRLGPPVPEPDKIICLGLNYREHADESDQTVLSFPPVFSKYRNSLIGPTDAIVMPQISTEIDYEAELAVVIGTRCKNVTAEHALDHVAGYSVFNDVSARDIQIRTPQWTAGKMLDTFGPMGPGLTPRHHITDIQNLRITTRINGTTMQDSNTSAMIWPVAEIVAYLSTIATLEPGDIIATGTPAGVGLAQTPPLWLKGNDTVTTEIEQLGQLHNPVVNVDDVVSPSGRAAVAAQASS